MTLGSTQPLTEMSRPRLKCDDTRAGTRFRLSAKRTNPFQSAGASVQSTTGSRGVRITGSNDGYTMFWGSVKGTGFPLHSPVSSSLPLPCVTVCHHISTGLYQLCLLGVMTAGVWGYNLFVCRLSRNSGSLNLLEPPGPVQACTGIALPFTVFANHTLGNALT